MCELGTTAAWTSEPLRAPLDLLTLTAAAEHWQVEPIVDYTAVAWAPAPARDLRRRPHPPRRAARGAATRH